MASHWSGVGASAAGVGSSIDQEFGSSPVEAGRHFFSRLHFFFFSLVMSEGVRNHDVLSCK